MKTVKRYGANAVEIDGVLVSYDTKVARILRAALRFRPGGRQASFEWEYFINGGKLDWFQYGN